eukprot:TRINITY_DN33914_c0_g1_i1.p1 TRINITY_DN33914_c0_g1~~TRINITY_DN33914_c0_g1_i1.p1  ORF type:complete len:260 (+),score=46.23 TRINITY_DN33914_c0_g1_i1:52-831(+)
MLRCFALCATLSSAVGLVVGMAQVEGQTGATPKEEMNNNIVELSNLTAIASKQGVRAIVFPEFGLFSKSFGKASKNCTELRDYCDLVPAPGSATCSGSTQADQLSCVAKQSNLTLSVNVCELDESNQIWNSQLIFDGTGNMTHVYRKTHPFVHCFEAPSTPDLVTVVVDDETFGIFTCKDILYETPGVTLRHMGIDKFLYAADIAIVGETAVKDWSLDHNATMVYSDLNVGQGGVYKHGKRLTPKPTAGSKVIVYDLQL